MKKWRGWFGHFIFKSWRLKRKLLKGLTCIERITHRWASLRAAPVSLWRFFVRCLLIWKSIRPYSEECLLLFICTVITAIHKNRKVLSDGTIHLCVYELSILVRMNVTNMNTGLVSYPLALTMRQGPGCPALMHWHPHRLRFVSSCSFLSFVYQIVSLYSCW